MIKTNKHTHTTTQTDIQYRQIYDVTIRLTNISKGKRKNQGMAKRDHATGLTTPHGGKGRVDLDLGYGDVSASENYIHINRTEAH